MLFGAKNRNIAIGNTDVDFVSFGRGDKNLVIIPGLGDGLKTVKGMALTLAFMYRMYVKDYHVHIFSRKNELEEGYSTRDMARDLKEVLGKVGIEKADVMGLSQGGMIVQYLAIDHPQVVDKLVIGVSVSRQNETIQDVVGKWVEMAQAGDFKALTIDSLEKTYPENKVKKYRPLYPIITRFGKPKSFTRFIIQAKSCLGHNAYEELHKIESPTLVIGDDNDQVVGLNTSEEMAEQIPNNELYLTNGLGHGAFEEKVFNQQVLRFLSN